MHDPEKGRVDRDEVDQRRPHHHRPPPEPVGQRAAPQHRDHRHQIAQRSRRKADRLAQMQRALRIGRHVVEAIGRDRPAAQRDQRQHDDAPVFAHRTQAAALRFRDRMRLRVVQRLGQAPADPKPERDGDRAQQEGDAPAIGIERPGRHHGRQHHADGGARRRGQSLAGTLPRHREAPRLQRRRFEQIGGGRPDLAAEREALHHAREHRQDGGCDADHRIGRDDRDRHNGETHHGEAQHHHRAAADAVRQPAEHDAAERPRHEAGAERRQRQHQVGIGVGRWEKRVPDLDREEGVGDEVVEFERIADRRGSDGAPAELRGALVGHRQILHPPRRCARPADSAEGPALRN